MKDTQTVNLNYVDKLDNSGYRIENYEETKVKLANLLKYYSVPEVNEDNYPIAKQYKTSLNAFAKSIDDRRKKLEKSYMEPFNVGKGECKELIDMINTAVKPLKEGIDKVEEARKMERRKELEVYFNSANSYPITFSQIENDKWYNATTKMDDAKKDIDNTLIKINSDIYNFKKILDKKELRIVLIFYFETLDAVAASNSLTSFLEKEKEVEVFVND